MSSDLPTAASILAGCRPNRARRRSAVRRRKAWGELWDGYLDLIGECGSANWRSWARPEWVKRQWRWSKPRATFKDQRSLVLFSGNDARRTWSKEFGRGFALSYTDLRSGNVDDSEWPIILEAANFQLGLYIYDDPGLAISGRSESCGLQPRRRGSPAADCCRLYSTDGVRRSSARKLNPRNFADFEGLKRLARGWLSHLGVVAIVLPSKAGDKRPMLSDCASPVHRNKTPTGFVPCTKDLLQPRKRIGSTSWIS